MRRVTLFEDDMSSKTARIIVSYSTIVVDQAKVDELAPEFEAPSNYKDKEKIERYIAQKKANFFAQAASQPYTGTFKEIMLVDLQKQIVGNWSWEQTKENDLTVAENAASWILRNNPGAFDGDILDSRNSNVVFIGFNTRLFLKMLGLECTLPDTKVRVPLKLWYNNPNHRDIAEAVMPAEYVLSWPLVLAMREPVETATLNEKWAYLKTWKQPHVNVNHDSLLITELAAQLGFLND